MKKDLNYIVECPECGHNISYEDNDIKYVKRFEHLIINYNTGNGYFYSVDCYSPEEIAHTINHNLKGKIKNCSLRYSYSLPHLECPNCRHEIPINNKEAFYKDEII